MGQRPLGEGVGRETLVHQAQRGHTARVLQVIKVGADLVCQQQALVDHRAAGHAGNVIFLAVLQVEVLNGSTGGFADHIQLAFQRVLHDHIVATPNEHLADDGLLFANRRRHRHVHIDRHIAPSQQDLALCLDGTLHLLFAGKARGVLLGQKDHAHAVFAGGWQLHALQGHLFAIQRVGQLNQDPRAIAHQLVSAHRTPVVQIFENFERVGYDAVALLAPNMGHKSDAAGIVLLAGCIQPVVLKVLDFGCRRHGALLKNYKGERGYRTATKVPSKLIGVRFQLNPTNHWVNEMGDRLKR